MSYKYLQSTFYYRNYFYISIAFAKFVINYSLSLSTIYYNYESV